MMKDPLILEEILLSWKRCAKKGLTAEVCTPEIHSGKAALQKKQLLYKNILLLYNNVISEVSSNITTRCIFLLCDSDGFILAENWLPVEEVPRGKNPRNGMGVSQPAVEDMAAYRTCFTSGVSLAEESIGTNSVSLCLLLQRPILMLPQYHYCELLSECYEYCILMTYDNGLNCYLTIISVRQPVRPELITIAELLCYKICNEYLKTEKQNSQKPHEAEILSSKQIEILKHMAGGLTDYAISREMKLSISSVKYHKHNIFVKYNAASSTQAIVRAIKFSNLSLDDIG